MMQWLLRLLARSARVGAVGTTNEQQRHSWLEGTLRNIPADTRILDAGAGELANKPLCNHLQYVSQDFCEYDGVGDQAGLHTQSWDTTKIDIVSDIAAIPAPDASFGAVLCSEVLEHVPDPLAALQEFHRLLSPGGTLILTAPFASLTHFAPYHFSSGFSRYFFKHHLTRLGFEIVELIPNGNFFQFLAQEMRRVPSVAERYSAGPLSTAERSALKLALSVVEKLSETDRGSDDLLCFGYHVRAQKR
jgi:SAM-dependent methyltransferase